MDEMGALGMGILDQAEVISSQKGKNTYTQLEYRLADCVLAWHLEAEVLRAKRDRLISLLEVTAGRLDTERHRILAELEGL